MRSDSPRYGSDTSSGLEHLYEDSNSSSPGSPCGRIQSPHRAAPVPSRLSPSRRLQGLCPLPATQPTHGAACSMGLSSKAPYCNSSGPLPGKRQQQPSQSMAALYTTLSSLGVQLSPDSCPSSPKRSLTQQQQQQQPQISSTRNVMDISADIQRTMSSLQSIGTRLHKGPGGNGTTAAAVASGEPVQGLCTASGQASPTQLLKGASQQQVEQLRYELQQLNKAVTLGRRSITSQSSQQGMPAQQQPEQQQQQQPGMHLQPPQQAASPVIKASGPRLSRLRAELPESEGALAPQQEQHAGPRATEQQQQQQERHAHLHELQQHTPQQQPQPQQHQEQDLACPGIQGEVISKRGHAASLPGSMEGPARQKLEMARQAGARLQQLQAENHELRSSLADARGSAEELQHQVLCLQAVTPEQARAEAAQLMLTNQTLHRQLHAKEQAVAAAHAALRKLTSTTDDQRVMELQQQAQELQQQLLARDTALAATEAQLRQLQQQQQQGCFGKPASRGASQELGEGQQGLCGQVSGTLAGTGSWDDSRRGQQGDSSSMAGRGAAAQAALQSSLDRALAGLAERASEVAELHTQLQGLSGKHQAQLRDQEASFEQRMDVQRRRLEQSHRELDIRTREVALLQEQLAAQAAEAQQPAHAGGCADPGHSSLKQQLQQRTAEVDQMREALQQLHELLGCTLGSPRQHKGASVENLVLALQRRMQQLLADITSRSAELDRLKQQVAGGGGQGGLQRQGTAAAGELLQLRQQCRDLEAANAACMQELDGAARKLSAAEEQLEQMVVLQGRVGSLQQQVSHHQQQQEQQKQHVHVLQQHQERLIQAVSGQGAQGLLQLISELQQQLASAAVQLQQAKQLQERTAQQVEQYKKELSEARDSGPKLQQGQEPSSSGEVAEVRALQQQCASLQRQVAEQETKEARLHAAHAQLQEELCMLKVSGRQPDPHGTQLQQLLKRLSEVEQTSVPKADYEALQARCKELAGSLAALQEQAGKQAQLLGSGQRVVSPQEVEVLQQDKQRLQEELKARLDELQQWQTHAQALEQDLEDLQLQAAEVRDNHPVWVAEKARLQSTIAQQEQALHQAGANLQEARSELQAVRTSMSRLEYEIQSGADDYEALLRRHQSLEIDYQRSQDTIVDLRNRVEALTGPQGPQSKLRHMQHQSSQLQRKLEVAERDLAAARHQQAQLAAKLAAKEEEVLALDGQTSVLEQEVAMYRNRH